MGKGEVTRTAIVSRAVELATSIGLDGLSIGRLAEELKLSKSGLFAHFGSKDNLQVETIVAARAEFVESVVAPALKAPRGEPRVRELFERWLHWGARPGGCFFVAAAVELDDRPGKARDALVDSQRDWHEALATAARIAVEQGHFRDDLDPEQFAFEMYALMLGAHHFHHFIRDRKSLTRTRRAFEALVERARAARSSRQSR